MDDESSVFEAAETYPCSTCNSSATDDASQGASGIDPKPEDTPTGTDEATIGILADPGTDPDSDSKGSDPKAQASELEQLRGELRQLREELFARDARKAQQMRVEQEYAEFCKLFPNTSIAALPDEVWQDVNGGASLAAAYALAEKKRAAALARASDSNTHNRSRSAGAVQNTQNHEFSPAEVRAMSSQEVRANLPKIMRSMQKWH